MALVIEEKKKYRIQGKEEGDVMDFIVMTIVREKDEAYVKIVYPISHHQGLILSSLENRNDIEEVKE